MLAEDNELNAEILIELLGRRGAQIEWVDNGAKAVQTLAQRSSGPYDAVLMDVMMPVLKPSLDAGMDAHVAKPVDIDSLARVLGTVCR